MSAALRSELLKLRTTRTNVGLLVGLVGLSLFVILLHGFGLPAAKLATRDDQLMVFGWGTVLGVLFAGLVGALSITAEFRYGTLASTFLATPQRGRVIAAKVGASALAGFALGALAEAIVLVLGGAAFTARAITVQISAGDHLLLLLGGAVASAVWAAIGVGVGALVRNQVATLVGLCAWLLLVETLLLAYVPSAGRFAPGAAAGALSGATNATTPGELLAPALGGALVIAYGAALALAGAVATRRRDVA